MKVAKIFKCIAKFGGLICPILFSVSFVEADTKNDITFTNIVKDKALGVTFERAKSDTHAEIERIRQRSLTDPLAFTELFEMPTETHGLPGIAILDYDRDGDEDIYLTNGPGAGNALYSNQLKETGYVSFIDVAAEAGVSAYEQDSSGVCYGDIENDGDLDLLVLGRSEENLLYINDGNGKFTLSKNNGLGKEVYSSTSCSMGDVNNDGLLDIVVGNNWDLSRYSACFVENFELNEPNQLYINQGNHSFKDVSEESGILDLKGFPEEYAGAGGLTWAVGMIDMNQDGNTDIVFVDEQCATPLTVEGGVDRGFIHVMLNDGNANFVDEPIIINEYSSGGWMGLGVGDINCDNSFDVVASNGGDYIMPALGFPYPLGKMSTNWFLGNDNGTYSDPGVGDLIASVFSWGVGVFDYDNDGDQDLMFQGGLEINYQAWADNPGVLLKNEGCGANFTWAKNALSTDYTRLNARALALGDINKDGFTDFITSSNFVIPKDQELQLSPGQWGSVFDKTAYYLPIFEPRSEVVGDEQYVWNGNDLAPGYPTVEINSADNNNGSVAINLVGSVGLTKQGRVNRDGMGAIIKFTPKSKKSKTVMNTIPNGSSFASQHSLETIFGLGKAKKGTVEILWPGGVKNRLYNVRKGENVKFPEIPCSFDDKWNSKYEYLNCVHQALRDLVSRDVISRKDKHRYFKSAKRAYHEARIKRFNLSKVKY